MNTGKICDKAVDNYHFALKYVLDCYLAQKMCDKGANSYNKTCFWILWDSKDVW